MTTIASSTRKKKKNRKKKTPIDKMCGCASTLAGWLAGWLHGCMAAWLYPTHAALEFLAAFVFVLLFLYILLLLCTTTTTIPIRMYVCGEYSVVSIDTRLFIEEEQLSLSLYTHTCT